MTKAVKDKPADTVRLLQRITRGQGSMPLEGLWVETPRVTGKRRILNSGQNRLLSVATYGQRYLKHMSRILAGPLGQEFDPPITGHVQFIHNAGKTALEAMIYASPEVVIASAQLSTSSSEWGTDEAVSSYNAAQEFGLGQFWDSSVASIFRKTQAGNLVTYEPPQIEILNASLAQHAGLA